MAANWREYQDEAATFFRSLGLDAVSDVRVQGVRTAHDIDVLVKSRHAGFEVTWIVECKLWNAPVSKLHVLALREIVSDTGADRGVLLSESGFQSGAAEAAGLTNVHLTTLAHLRREASDGVCRMRLTDLYDRVEACRERYWALPKGLRIEYGLRPDAAAGGYSGASVISLAEDLLRKGFRGIYPFEPDYMWRAANRIEQDSVESPMALVEMLEPMVGDLEARIATCEAAIGGAEE
jgi:restriction system protein